MKKLVRVEGSSGRLYKMYLHKEPNNERGWYITESQYDKMNFREPVGWDFDRQDLEKIGCKWVNLVYRNREMTDVIIWGGKITKFRNVEAVRDRIDETFLDYCKSYPVSIIQKHIDGRLTGILYASVMLGAIDTEEYEYLYDAIKAVDINWRKGVNA